jgi:hypothetical protein
MPFGGPLGGGASGDALTPIPKSDGSGGIKDVHVLLGARIIIARQKFCRVLPFKQGHRKRRAVELVHVQNTKSAISLWTTHDLPIYLAFSPVRSLFGLLKESSLYFIDVELEP